MRMTHGRSMTGEDSDDISIDFKTLLMLLPCNQIFHFKLSLWILFSEVPAAIDVYCQSFHM